jgi:hypothetical protein
MDGHRWGLRSSGGVGFSGGVQASIFGVAAASGLALHWSCLIVAVVLAAIAGATYFKGQADAKKEVTPNRTIHQVKEDIATVKEQFS